MRLISIIIIALLLTPLLSHADDRTTISGTIHIFYGYYNGNYTTTYMLESDGEMIHLNMSYYKDTPNRLENRYATLEGVFKDGVFYVYSIQTISSASVNNIEVSVTGEQAWVTILARFADVSSTPKDPTFFDNLLYNDTYPSLNHYWKEVSYNNISITGATYGWYNLTNNKAYYTDGSDPLCGVKPDFAKLLDNMTALADPYVNFNDYVGINLVYNEDIGSCVWGGSALLTIDGSTRVYRVTFLSSSAFEHKFFAHEMGHGFGLPHSSGPYGYPYDSEWDVMSEGSSCRIVDPEYGCLAVHTISYHKELLDWIPSSNIFVMNNNSIATIALYPLENITNGYIMAKVPLSTGEFYTIEYRRLDGYDINVPDNAIIIHHVDESREIPAQVIDTDNNGNPNDEGAIWRVGETFNDNINNINITIIEDLGDHYLLSISTSDLDLNKYTSSLIDNGVLDALFILGDSDPHGPRGWGAAVDDVIGSIGVASKLGQLSTSGNTTQALDTNISTYDDITDIVNIDWNKINSSMIVVGGPGVNLISYYYDKERVFPFYLLWNDSIPHIHSALTDSDYNFSNNIDYAIIGITNDNGRDILIAWGLTANGTVAATQLLQHYDTIYNGMLSGKAMIIKWIDNGNGVVDINDDITIIERWQ